VKQQLQVDRIQKFKKKHAEKAKRALDQLATVAEHGENVFPSLLEAAEVCSLGQITGRLQEVVGRFRPMV
jgi:methylmalonyl-CoA mutase